MNLTKQANRYRLLLIIILSLMHPKVSQNISDNAVIYQDGLEEESARFEEVGLKDGRQDEDNFERRAGEKLDSPNTIKSVQPDSEQNNRNLPNGEESLAKNTKSQQPPAITQSDNSQKDIIKKEKQIHPQQKELEEQKAKQSGIAEKNQSKNTQDEVNMHEIKQPSPVQILSPTSQIEQEKEVKKPQIPSFQELLQFCKQKAWEWMHHLRQYFQATFIVEISRGLEKFVLKLVNYFPRTMAPLARSYYQLYKILIDDSKPKTKKVYYENNYANLHGGAKIIMKSSPKIMSINSILIDDTDKYLYTDQKLPIKLIIGLNEEIAIDSIIIQSYEMYSCITKDFIVEGKFTMEDKKWVYLGQFRAENTFGDQQFYTDRKIIRYIKITFLSAYGKWSYFTLTQIKIRGRGLFADALTELTEKKYSDDGSISDRHQYESHKDDGEDRPPNTCSSEFKPISNEPHESNLITSVITKIDNLETKNTAQAKQLQLLTSKLGEVTSLLISKTLQNQKSMEVLNQYKSDSDRAFYVIIASLSLSGLTLCCLICLCLVRRKELIEIKSRGKEKFQVKKSNSLD